MIKQKENGSLLVLTLIAVLVLSLLMIGLLTVGTTELQSTQNYQLNKNAYYSAVQGVEEIRNIIHEAPDPVSISTLSRSKYDTEMTDTFGTINLGYSRAYITGTLKDWEENTPQTIQNITGDFRAPYPRGTSLPIDGNVWKVTVTAEAKMANRVGYAQIEAGIYSVIEKAGYN
jgi:Tfp pilus assembly protein PilV